jgi:acylphosphatase
MSDPGSSGRRLVAHIHGTVQGVGFRWFVQREASGLGLTGWSANLADDSVEVVAEGPPADLERLLAALRVGPSGSSVSRIDVRHEPARGDLVDFVIRSGAHRGD